MLELLPSLDQQFHSFKAWAFFCFRALLKQFQSAPEKKAGETQGGCRKNMVIFISCCHTIGWNSIADLYFSNPFKTEVAKIHK
jgi:hypothetical protein